MHISHIPRYFWGNYNHLIDILEITISNNKRLRVSSNYHGPNKHHITMKHVIHKFRDGKPRLRHDNWSSWKHKLLATAGDRGLYKIITGTNLIPRETNPATITAEDIIYIGTIPLTLLTDEWNDRNNSAYNQILLCIPQNSKQQSMIPTKLKSPGTLSSGSSNPPIWARSWQSLSQLLGLEEGGGFFFWQMSILL